jgi:membrane-bound lytic murein transglycosylase B
VFSNVSASVNTAIQAEATSQSVTDAAQTARANLTSRVQEIYESGGSLAAYASMLVTGNINELSSRSVIFARVVSVQASETKHASARAAAADALVARTSRRELAQIGTERDVAAAADHVQKLLDQEKTLLAAADSRLAAIQAAARALAAEQASYGSITAAQIAGLRVLPPSTAYLDLYKGAATTCPGLSWTVLAAIGQVESGHGRNVSTSSAGAMGPMQFEPATFAAYAVDGDHDGVTSIMDPADAIYTAAHYLCANGAGRGSAALNGAILHYNHAGWYVEMVLKLASEYATWTP